MFTISTANSCFPASVMFDLFRMANQTNLAIHEVIRVNCHQVAQSVRWLGNTWRRCHRRSGMRCNRVASATEDNIVSMHQLNENISSMRIESNFFFGEFCGITQFSCSSKHQKPNSVLKKHLPRCYVHCEKPSCDIRTLRKCTTSSKGRSYFTGWGTNLGRSQNRLEPKRILRQSPRERAEELLFGLLSCLLSVLL